jgi:osmotically-inducible protein OsmY
MSLRYSSGWSAFCAGIAAALAAGCASSPPRSPAQVQADEATANRIYAALERDPVYYFKDADVGVDDGVARLGGYVWTTAALYRAQRIARSVPGVTAVKDELQLERAAQRGGGDGGGAQ